MPINPQSGFPTAGVAGKYEDTITAAEVAFVAGDYPALMDRVHTAASGQVLEALTVVGLSAGEIVPANNGAVTAIGVLVYPVDTSPTGTNAATDVQVYRTGHFNMDELVWDAGYTTDAEKVAAFDGADAPTHIFVTKTETFAV